MLTMLRHGTIPGWSSIAWAATARSLFAHLIARADPGAIILPRYAPEGLTVPAKKSGVPVASYGLGDDLLPDVVDLAHQIDRHNRPLVVLIHYFGFPTPAGLLTKYAQARGGWVLHDCAQALLGEASVARDADFALYSINKWLPVVDGAILKSRANVDVSLLNRHPMMTPAAVTAYQHHLSTNGWIAASETIAHAMQAKESSAEAYDRYYREGGSSLMMCEPLSKRSLELADLDMIAKRHRLHADYLVNRIKLRVHAPRGNTVPWCLPVRFRSRDDRDAATAALLEAGIVAEVQADKWTEHPFVDDHLLLPIGVDATLHELDAMVKTLRRFA